MVDRHDLVDSETHGEVRSIIGLDSVPDPMRINHWASSAEKSKQGGSFMKGGYDSIYLELITQAF